VDDADLAIADILCRTQSNGTLREYSYDVWSPPTL
jgi:hypothetical protein